MDNIETAKFLKALVDTYPNYFGGGKLTSAIAAWQMVFDDVPLEYALKGLREHIRESDRTYPTANDIYRRANEIKRYEFFHNGGKLHG